jgi:hypothetical protein
MRVAGFDWQSSEMARRGIVAQAEEFGGGGYRVAGDMRHFANAEAVLLPSTFVALRWDDRRLLSLPLPMPFPAPVEHFVLCLLCRGALFLPGMTCNRSTRYAMPSFTIHKRYYGNIPRFIVAAGVPYRQLAYAPSFSIGSVAKPAHRNANGASVCRHCNPSASAIP